MLPAKIKDLITELRARTENQKIKWHYNDDESTVSMSNNKFNISITYRFDDIEEVGRFNIKYTDNSNNKEYFFSTTQNYDDYEALRILYDSAQSSDLDVDMDF